MGRKALPTDEMNLTEREHKVLNFLEDCIAERGYPPTVREICQKFGVKSTSTIHKDLNNLEKKHFISKDPSKPRTIEILKSGRPERNGSFGPEAEDHHVRQADVTNIPVVGRVAAGLPILADENIDEYYPVPASAVTGAYKYFMLLVKGESMIEAGIMDGDYILVREQDSASNGQMVVAVVNNGFESEATVKTFYRENGHIRLQPENHTMKPIIVNDVRIAGLVKGVFRFL